MNNEEKTKSIIDLANSILMNMEGKKMDSASCYAALGCAFIQLHQGLGHGKEDWLSLTKDMAELNEWKEE